VSARLVVAVIVPVVALALVGGRVVADRHQDVERAEGVPERLEVIDRLIDLRAALFAERVAAEILVPARRPPDAVLATTAFGRKILDGSGPLAKATDAALAALPPQDRPFEPSELAAIRADRASWSASPDTIRVRLGPLSTRTGALLLSYVTDVRATAVKLGNTDLIEAGTTLQRSIALPDAAGEIFGALSDLWAAAPADRAMLQSVVAATAATFGNDARRFAESITDPDGPIADFWRGPMQVPAPILGLLDQARAGELSTPERPAGEPAAVGATLLQSIDWTIQADALPMIAADEMSVVAGHVADDARSTERVTFVLILLAFGLSVGAAVLFGRSIIAPVRRLTNQAKRVGSGDLALDPLPLGGPPDVAAASAAFNDVVATLRLLERKSHALADIDLDHPALREQLPGELGASLQRSTEILSTSIVDREQLRSQLVHDATHDSLTGLANRAAVLDALSRLAGADGPTRRAAVIFIDLDGFKRINDRQGHGVGDVVLQVMAGRINTLAPAGSTIARLGGDEFVVLLHDVRDPDSPSALARAMVDAAAAPITVHAERLTVRACAGVAVADPSPCEQLPGPADLLQRADLAVFTAKQTGPGTVASYDAAFGRRVAQEADIEMALSAALRPGADELRLVYQPIVATDTGALASIETLVRWDRRGHGRVLPDDFIPIAERSGLIVSLDMWVMRNVARQLAAWSSVPGLRDVPVSVNVSGRTLLQSNFVGAVAGALRAESLEPSRLKVEVTETALVTDLALAAEQLARVRLLGVRVAIDDFGTGYTSIAHLRAMPVDELKIDGSFIQRLPDVGNRVLIQMINDLADLLGITTVAEGVETREQIDILSEIGCDALQGYYFSPPMDPGAIARWAARQAPAGTGATIVS
jgi:diguanylate cyclase (GGDEF)-like protein